MFFFSYFAGRSCFSSFDIPYFDITRFFLVLGCVRKTSQHFSHKPTEPTQLFGSDFWNHEQPRSVACNASSAVPTSKKNTLGSTPEDFQQHRSLLMWTKSFTPWKTNPIGFFVVENYMKWQQRGVKTPFFSWGDFAI